MRDIRLKATTRQAQGKALATIRQQGLVPGIVYGQGKPAVAIQAAEGQLGKVYHQAGTSQLVQLEIDPDEAKTVLFHEVQRHPVSNKILHFDLYTVRMDQVINTEVPLHFVGDSEAVHQFQAVLVKPIEMVEIEALPKDLPENIEVDIGQLAELEDAIYVKDLKVPEGVKILNEPEDMVVKAEPPQETTQEDLEAEAAEDAELQATEGAEVKVESEHGGAEEEGEEGADAEGTAEEPPTEEKQG